MPETAESITALEAAAALLLRPPDERVRALVSAWSGETPSLDGMRQDFYDVLCVPQSGRYVPLYEHVVRQARRVGRMWFFPPARHDGGRLVGGYYLRCGFDRRRLEVHPILAAPHLPGDHLGFMLAFVSWLLGARQKAGVRDVEAIDRQLRVFVGRHLDDWVETCSALLEDRGGAYLAAIASATRDAVRLARGASGERAAA